ncbi:MAG: S8 family peptidase [Candidatus Woesearchaeota archaeon]
MVGIKFYHSKNNTCAVAANPEQLLYSAERCIIAAEEPGDSALIAKLACLKIKPGQLIELILEQRKSGRVYLLGPEESYIIGKDLQKIPEQEEKSLADIILGIYQETKYNQIGLRQETKSTVLFSKKTGLFEQLESANLGSRVYEALTTNLQQRLELERRRYTWTGIGDLIKNAKDVARDEYQRLRLKEETQDILNSCMKSSYIIGRLLLKDRLVTVEKGQNKAIVAKHKVNKENIQALLDEEYQPKNIRSLIIANHGSEIGMYMQREAGCKARRMAYAPYTILTGSKKDIERILQMHSRNAYHQFSTPLKKLLSRSKLHYNKGIYLPEVISEFTDKKIAKTRSANMWNLKNIGAFEAQSVTRGQNTKVGIIDTGVDYNHVELAQLFGEEKGYDFVLDNNKPLDKQGHGTHVAGTAGGKNIGVATACNMLSLRVLDENGAGTLASLIEAVSWAVLKKLDVLNLSLGSKDYSMIEYETFLEAGKAGIVVCAAAGNDQYGPDYPGAYDCVTAVAAVDRSNEHAYFSNIQDTNNISAPGVGIYSSIPHNRFDCLSGTSMATPHASGVAALAKSLKPELDNQGFIALLEKSAEKLGDPSDEDNYATYGAGLVRADKIVGKINGR